MAAPCLSKTPSTPSSLPPPTPWLSISDHNIRWKENLLRSNCAFVATKGRQRAQLAFLNNHLRKIFLNIFFSSSWTHSSFSYPGPHGKGKGCRYLGAHSQLLHSVSSLSQARTQWVRVMDHMSWTIIIIKVLILMHMVGTHPLRWILRSSCQSSLQCN